MRSSVFCSPSEAREFASREYRGHATGTGRSRGHARWVLEICGPFCLWRHRSQASIISRARNVTDSISNLLTLPCKYWRLDEAIEVRVQITADERASEIGGIYADSVAARTTRSRRGLLG